MFFLSALGQKTDPQSENNKFAPAAMSEYSYKRVLHDNLLNPDLLEQVIIINQFDEFDHEGNYDILFYKGE